MSCFHRSLAARLHGSRWRFGVLLVLMLAGGSGCAQAPQAGSASPTAAGSPGLSAAPVAAGPSGEALNAARRKISSALLQALDQRRGTAGASPPLETGVEIDSQGLTVVDITADVSDALLARIETLGATVLDSIAQARSIRARVPLEQVETIAADQAVIRIQPAQAGTTNSP